MESDLCFQRRDPFAVLLLPHHAKLFRREEYVEQRGHICRDVRPGVIGLQVFRPDGVQLSRGLADLAFQPLLARLQRGNGGTRTGTRSFFPDTLEFSREPSGNLFRPCQGHLGLVIRATLSEQIRKEPVNRGKTIGIILVLTQ